MAIKDLLVYVDHDSNAAERVRFAKQLATTHEAHLTGVYVRQQIILPAYVDAQIPPEVTEAAERAAEERAQEAEKKFTGVRVIRLNQEISQQTNRLPIGQGGSLLSLSTGTNWSRTSSTTEHA